MGEEKWKGLNIDLGFLVALTVGAGSLFLASSWLLTWLDDRIADALTLTDARVEELETQTKTHREYIEELRRRCWEAERRIDALEEEE